MNALDVAPHDEAPKQPTDETVIAPAAAVVVDCTKAKPSKAKPRKAKSGKAKPSTTNDEGKARAQATVLTELGKVHDLFHDDGGDAYAAIPAGSGTSVMLINGSGYKELLGRDYYRLVGQGANRNAISDAINTLTAIAKYDGPCEKVWLRTGSTPKGIALDIGDDSYRVIVVTAEGWSVEDQAPIRFRRSGKPTALPIPTKATTANIKLLWDVLNVSEADRPLVLGWLLAALRPTGACPLLVLVGEQGSAKSTATRILKKLTDPSAVLLRAPVKDESDLLVAAYSSRVLALDNLSGIDPKLADALCRLATGGGMSSRKLYSDHDETLIDIQRPIILNGIDELANRPDLAQRCIQLELPVIPDHARRSEAAVMAEFDAKAPAIMAALLDAVTLALRDVGRIKRDRLPRMADFALWAAAGLPALGYDADDFLSDYRAKCAKSVEEGLDSSALARALRKFMEREVEWKGAKLRLLELLAAEAHDHDRSQSSWPRTPKGLTNALRRLAPSLRHVGITFEPGRSSEARAIKLHYAKPCEVAKQVSQVSSVTDCTPAGDAMTLVTHEKPVCTVPAPVSKRVRI